MNNNNYEYGSYTPTQYLAYPATPLSVAIPEDALDIDWSKVPASVESVTATGLTGNTRTYTRPKPEVLTLSPAEAQALRGVLGRVGGNGTGRSEIHCILVRLENAGYTKGNAGQHLQLK